MGLLQGCTDETVCPEAEVGLVRIMCEPDSLEIPWSLTVPGGLFAAGVSDTVLAFMDAGEYTISWGQADGWLRADTNATTLVLEVDSAIDFQAVFVEDDSPSGSISVEPMPVCIDPSWVLSGPNGFITDGTHGAVVFSDLEEGDYTLAWGTVPGWVTPDPDVVEMSLPEGGSLVVSGVYVEKATGMIAVDPNPDSINATWQLLGEEGFSYEGSGDMTLGNIVVGEYTVVWGDVDQWVTPSAEALTVIADDTVTFVGEYGVDLPLSTTPDVLMSNFHTVNEEMFYEGYESILHGAHRTVVMQSTFDDWQDSDRPLTSLYFDRDLATTIHHNLFNGAWGIDETGLPITPIDSISIPILEKLGPWEPVDPSMEYFGEFDAYLAPYSILMHFNKPDGSRFEVDQMIQFIAVEESGVWKLLGIIPMGRDGVLATENSSYDGVLSLYR
jgi:hypothetical protein